MRRAFFKKRLSVWLWLVAVGLVCMSTINLPGRIFAAESSANDSKQVKILSNGVELIEVMPGSGEVRYPKGANNSAQASDNPLDVRLYIHTGWKQWLPKDFPNHKQGDEITDYRCGPPTDYKVYAHAAGSNEAWPKP